MQRFTISHHAGSKEGDHFDLMLELGEALKTWRFASLPIAGPQAAKQLRDHRKVYLDHEGDIPGGRGSVKVWDTGTYVVDEWADRRICIAVVGRQLRTRLRLQASGPAAEGREQDWTLADAAAPLRKAASTFLREAGLDDAPTPELEDLRGALAREEKQLLGVVDQFTRGSEVQWSNAATDADVRRRLEKERTRWQHPWLVSATAYAASLETLAALLRAAR